MNKTVYFWGVVYGVFAGVISGWVFVSAFALATVIIDRSYEFEEWIFASLTFYLMFGGSIGAPIGLLTGMIMARVIYKQRDAEKAPRVGSYAGILIGVIAAVAIAIIFRQSFYLRMFRLPWIFLGALTGCFAGLLSGLKLRRKFRGSVYN